MENLELYYGNQVQVTMEETCRETCKEGILFPGDTGQLVLKNEVNEDILLRSDVKDVRYVGYITDYKTREDKVILDNAISFKFSKITDKDLSKKIKYEEFVCEVYVHLEFDEKTKKIVAKVSDIELKSSVHVVNNKLLEERFLYKFAGEDGWKLGYLQERDCFAGGD